MKISTAGGNRFRGGIQFKVYNEKLGFTIENDERHVSNGLNIIRHNDDAAGSSALFIQKSNGNVGIGTVKPGSHKLNVQGSARVNSDLEVGGNLKIGDTVIGKKEIQILKKLAGGTLIVDLFNTAHKEYLYAASDYFNYDNDRRRVFTWRKKQRVTQGYWALRNAR